MKICLSSEGITMEKKREQSGTARSRLAIFLSFFVSLLRQSRIQNVDLDRAAADLKKRNNFFRDRGFTTIYDKIRPIRVLRFEIQIGNREREAGTGRRESALFRVSRFGDGGIEDHERRDRKSGRMKMLRSRAGKKSKKGSAHVRSCSRERASL